MPSTMSPNMGLTIPTVGQEPGPDYANDINNDLNVVIDQHDHSPGRGVQVTPAGLNINTDLSMNSQNLTVTRSVRLSPLASTSSITGTDLNAVVSVGANGDLYYVDANGNQVQITNNGSIAGTNGSISGLTSPASASYNSTSKTFIWQQNTNTAANMDVGPLLMRNTNASSNAITFSAPSSLPSSYSLTLPSANPAATSIVTVSSAGNIAYPDVYPITSTSLAANSVTNSAIASASVTPDKVSVTNYAFSSTSSYSNATSSYTTAITVSITSNGRPVMILPTTNSSASSPGGRDGTIFSTGAANAPLVRILRDNSVIVGAWGINISLENPASAFACWDLPSSGAHTYELQLAGGGGTTAQMTNVQMVVLEIL